MLWMWKRGGETHPERSPRGEAGHAMQSRSRGQIQAAQSPGRRLTHLENNWNELLVDNPVSSAPPIPIQCRTHSDARTRTCAHTRTHTMIQRGKRNPAQLLHSRVGRESWKAKQRGGAGVSGLRSGAAGRETWRRAQKFSEARAPKGLEGRV